KVLQYYEGLKNHDRYYLAKAITLVESSRKDHKYQAQQLLSVILDVRHSSSNSASTFRIGLSGPPGVGKSTFIERFGMHILSQGHRVAVLAIDPSSSRTGGSILGDKTRMLELSRQDNAYIRPSASHGTLGFCRSLGLNFSTWDLGLGEIVVVPTSRNTNEAMIMCEAAGFDVCLIETVGVGQSETMVADMVDMFILMVPPAGGDEIQGLKKGIVEISDMVVVNKDDGALENAAREAVIEYTSALKYLRHSTPFWKPKSSGELQIRRGNQRKLWMWRQITSELLNRLNSDESIKKLVDVLEKDVFDGKMTSGTAADHVVDVFTHKNAQV
ncbi:10216_t:CDS:10, partial [Cetraspora pellucida]